mmetsp:Transcript_21020/g.66395  ORF Transcript_21020/g.66395 Transcript_21020/m.66395 type:complete len:305 (-) Transcript_21020:36-950(-)
MGNVGQVRGEGVRAWDHRHRQDELGRQEGQRPRAGHPCSPCHPAAVGAGSAGLHPQDRHDAHADGQRPQPLPRCRACRPALGRHHRRPRPLRTLRGAGARGQRHHVPREGGGGRSRRLQAHLRRLGRAARGAPGGRAGRVRRLRPQRAGSRAASLAPEGSAAGGKVRLPGGGGGRAAVERALPRGLRHQRRAGRRDARGEHVAGPHAPERRRRRALLPGRPCAPGHVPGLCLWHPAEPALHAGGVPLGRRGPRRAQQPLPLQGHPGRPRHEDPALRGQEVLVQGPLQRREPHARVRARRRDGQC